jgi:hypothetical protein
MQALDEMLSAYLDGELSQKEQLRLEARLERDPALQERLKALQHTVALVRNLPRVQAPRNFLLAPAIVAESRPGPTRRWVAPALTFATAASALICVAVLATNLVAGGLASRPEAALAPAEVAMEPATEETAGTTMPFEASQGEEEELAETPIAPQEAAPTRVGEGDRVPGEQVITPTALPTALALRGGPTPTATAVISDTPPPTDVWGVTETPPPPAVAAHEEASPVPTTEPRAQARWPLVTGTTALLAGGFSLLTLCLGVGAALAWRAHRR